MDLIQLLLQGKKKVYSPIGWRVAAGCHRVKSAAKRRLCQKHCRRHRPVRKHLLTTSREVVVKLGTARRKTKAENAALQAARFESCNRLGFQLMLHFSQFHYRSESARQALADKSVCFMQTKGDCSNLRATKRQLGVVFRYIAVHPK